MDDSKYFAFITKHFHLFCGAADTLDRIRTRINEYNNDDVDPYDDIHNADDPNITKNYRNENE